MGQENIVEVENNFNSIIGKLLQNLWMCLKRYLEGTMTPYMLNFRRWKINETKHSFQEARKRLKLKVRRRKEIRQI